MPKFWSREFLVFPLFLLLVSWTEGNAAQSSLETVRVSDFVDYTHVLFECSGSPGQVDITPASSGNTPVLVIKMSIGQGGVPTQVPAASDIIQGNIALASNGGALTVTVPCSKNADLSQVVWNVWDDMVTVDIPLKIPNHDRIPSVEKIKAFREQGGKVVIIDPGHGGYDSGAVPDPYIVKNPRMCEKDVVLDLSKRLERLFAQHPKVWVFLTRYGDYLPVPFGLKGRSRNEYKNASLRYRVQLAQEYLGNAYISLHLNAPPEVSSRSRRVSLHNRARGFEVYYLGDKNTGDLIEKNPDVMDLINLEDDQSKDDNLSRLMLHMMRDNIPQLSMDLAGSIVSEVKKISWMEIREPSIKAQRLAVLKQLLMPSILVECMFITNPTEHERMRNSANRSQLVASVYNAVCKFLFEPSEPVAPSENTKPLLVASNNPTPEPDIPVEEPKISPLPEPKAIPTPPKSVEPVYHTVMRNETLSSIADQFNMQIPDLRKLNPGKIGRKDLIVPGDVLLISGFSPQESPAKAAPIVPPTQNIASSKIAPHQDYQFYTIRRGDTLDSIARHFGTDSDSIRKANGFRGRNPIIHPDDKIKVPVSDDVKPRVNVASAKPQSYTIQRNDSLDKIARKFGTSVAKLKEINSFTAKNPLLHPGDSILVP